MEKNITQKIISGPTRTVKVEARGELFRIVQLHGTLLVCSKAHGNCCCGWTEKGRAPVNLDLYQQEWEGRRIRNKVHLSFTGCLGPCAVGNNALLQLSGRSIWFKDLNDDKYIPLVFDYIENLLQDRYAPPPADLAEHIYDRYLPPPVEDNRPEGRPGAGNGTTQTASASAVTEEEIKELEWIDPVCLMEVEPATARWKTEYSGRNFYFCAPACKKSFEKEPQAYL